MYGNQWRMIGGKQWPEEKSWQAAQREFWEETRLKARLMWTLPALNQFYDWKTDTIYHIPAFAVEVAPDAEPILNEEHSEWKWFNLDEALEVISWPEQQKMLRLLHQIEQNETIVPEWIVEQGSTD